MAMTRAALTDTDIRALVRGPTEDERAAVAHRLCRKIEAGVSDEERESANEVLRLMAADDLAWCDQPQRPAFAVPRLRIYEADPAAPPPRGPSLPRNWPDGPIRC